MFKPSFAEQPKKTEASDPLKALFKINAGLRELQSSKPELNQGAPSVAQQIQQQGIAALTQSEEVPGEAIQTIPGTPMGKVAMQANVAGQIKEAEQAQLQQQLMQMASQQQPQRMASGGIAALSAKNMKFQHGGVVGFNGEGRSSVSEEEKQDPSWYEKFPEGALIRKIGSFLKQQNKNMEELNTRDRVTGEDLTKFYARPEQLYSIPKLAPVDIPEITVAESPALNQKPDVKLPPARPSASAGGLGSLASSLGKVDLSAAEADKQASLDAVKQQEKNLPAAYTMPQLQAEREAAAKAMGIDLYGAEAKARTAALEKEFANQSAARAEANKSRPMDNLITMFTNMGNSKTLFAGMAKGTQAYQAAEKLQKADDIIWGGKKLEFMEKVNAQRDLLNERNKAMMLGDLTTVRDRDEKIRLGKNAILQQVAEVQAKSMSDKAQAAIHASKNATDLAINQARIASEAANREAAREGSNFAALQSRINQNAQTSSNIIEAMNKDFRTQNAGNIAMDGVPGGNPKPDKAWEDKKAAHQLAIKQEMIRAANENYKLEHYQWLKYGKAAGQPEPVKPTQSSPGGNIPGYFVIPQ